MFPFWIATKPAGGAVVVPDAPQYAAAFRTLNGAVAFLERAGVSEFEFHLVSRVTFAEIEPRLRQSHLVGLCFDPGGKRRRIPFENVGRIL